MSFDPYYSSVAENLYRYLYQRNDVKEVFYKLQKQVFAQGGCYHYNKNRVDQLGKIERSNLAQLPYENGKSGLNVTVTGAVLPYFLNENRFKEIVYMGKLLKELMNCQKSLFQMNADIQSRMLNDEECQHEKKFNCQSVNPLCMRVDFIVERYTQKLFIVDINLLPGGLFFVDSLTKSCVNILNETGFYCNSFDFYKIEKWWSYFNSINVPDTCFQRTPLHVSAKPDHGLFNEFVRISSYFSNDVEAFSPPLSLKLEKGSVIRGFRLKALEQNEFDNIKNLTRTGVRFFPGFNLYLENHQWFFFVRKYRKEIEKKIGRDATRWILDHFPKTFLIKNNSGTAVTVDPATSDEMIISEKNIGNHVLKLGGSTGGRGVTVIKKNGGRRTKLRALNLIYEPENQDKYILQKLIVPSKYPIYGFDHNSQLNWTSLPMKFSVYYCGGSFVGGVAVARPGYKVYGSLRSVNIPILWDRV